MEECKNAFDLSAVYVTHIDCMMLCDEHTSNQLGKNTPVQNSKHSLCC